MSQVQAQTSEQALNELLRREEPTAEDVLALVKHSLQRAITKTEKTTKQCYELIERLEQ